MSFILDALRKAESRRGQPATPVADHSPLGDIAEPGSSDTPRIALTVGVLGSAVIVAALGWWLGRQAGNGAPDVDTRVSSETRVAMPVDDSRRVVRPLDGEIQRARPAPAAPPAVVENSADAAPIQSDAASPAFAPPRQTVAIDPGNNAPPLSRRGDDVPTYAELALSGRAQLPQMHLDIHVYAAAPQRRFVFINNRKYREGGQLENGATVESITPHGAVLTYRGHRFALSPE